MSSESGLVPDNASKLQKSRRQLVKSLFRKSTKHPESGSTSVVPAIKPSDALESPLSDEGPLVLCDGGKAPEVEYALSVSLLLFKKSLCEYANLALA
jgi:hypothetical protein